jgi:hypothetical protein
LLYYSLGALLLGGQMLSLGLLAELIAAQAVRDTDNYSILEETAGAASRQSDEDHLAGHAVVPDEHANSGEV